MHGVRLQAAGLAYFQLVLTSDGQRHVMICHYGGHGYSSGTVTFVIYDSILRYF